jgi:putative restriction endonuclease
MLSTPNSGLVREAKRLFKKKNGGLFCEVCKFDFEAKYGKRGKDYIEAHHKTPVSKLVGTVTLTTDDLAMVCSNCHRMLHRPPWITVEELEGLI